MPTQPTRAEIVEKADALFYQQGFDATSFRDIADAVGISRGNFYYHFKSKDQILDAVIDRRLEVTQAMLDDWQAAGDSPRARIRCFINILVANRAKIMLHGCPVGTLSAELAKLDHAAQGRAAEIFALFRDWLAGQFQSLGADDPQALALHLLARSQGIATLMTAFHDESFMRREVDALAAWVDAVTPPQPQER